MVEKKDKKTALCLLKLLPQMAAIDNEGLVVETFACIGKLVHCH